MASQPDSRFKLEYRKLQSEYAELKDHWLPSVWAHVQSLEKGLKEDYKAAIKHFLGKK